MAKILLIEDDEKLIKPLKDWLETDGHVVETVSDGLDAEQMLSNYNYDVVVLDWGLPSLSGFDLLKRYRNSGGRTPVIFLTGQDDSKSKRDGLDIGADDYLTKPFDSEELSARIRALLRRPAALVPTTIRVGAVTLELGSQTVFVGGQPVSLGKREYAVLEYLMRHPNKTFSSQQLINAVWPSDTESSEDSVRACMRVLRNKLTVNNERCPIATVRGAGYLVRTEPFADGESEGPDEN